MTPETRKDLYAHFLRMKRTFPGLIEKHFGGWNGYLRSFTQEAP